MRSAGSLSLLLALSLLLTTSLSACVSSTSRTPNGGTEERPTATTSTTLGQSGGNWQTVTNLSGESVSSGEGTNSSVQSTSFDASGPYQVLAACQGSGSLTIEVSSQNAMTFQCSTSRNTPTKVAGGDAGSGDTIDVSVTPQGQVAWYQVLAQVQA